MYPICVNPVLGDEERVEEEETHVEYDKSKDEENNIGCGKE